MKYIIVSALMACLATVTTAHAQEKKSEELQGTVQQMIEAAPKDEVIRVTAEEDDEFADLAAEYGVAGSGAGAISDPYEKVNRAIFGFNQTVDDLFFAPIARGYRYVVPQYGRDRIGSFLNNLFTPVSFVNSILQGDVDNSFRSFWRFTLNSTFGIGGLFDVATEWGLEEQSEDMDQTLAVYGVGSGPYLMLPIIGPSTPRGIVGRVGDFFTFPLSYAEVPIRTGYFVSDAIHGRSELLPLTDQIAKDSLDPYNTMKSGYIQFRQGLIENRNVSQTEAYKND